MSQGRELIAEIPTLRDRMCEEMLATANELLAASAESFRELPVGVGLHCGIAWVGNVGEADMKDFTALGDVVNRHRRSAPSVRRSGPDRDGGGSPPPTHRGTCREGAAVAIEGKDDALRAHVVEPLAIPVR